MPPPSASRQYGTHVPTDGSGYVYVEQVPDVSIAVAGVIEHVLGDDPPQAPSSAARAVIAAPAIEPCAIQKSFIAQAQNALSPGMSRFEMTTRWMFPVPSKMS
jgi:hypothetical protein